MKKVEVMDSGLVVLEDVKVHVPLEVLVVCRKIQEKVGKNEFSILCKGRWSERGYEVGKEYVVPKQEVSGASVDYKEGLEKYKRDGYVVVIHSHPWGGGGFSRDDDETINSHFECSVLFGGKEFTNAVVTVEVMEGVKLMVDAEIVVEYDTDVEVDTSNITEKKHEYLYPLGKRRKVVEMDEDELLEEWYLHREFYGI